MKRAYDEFQKLKHLQLQFMQDHREISKGVFVSTFESGEEIVVNYTSAPFEYKGESVPAKGYRHFAK